MSLRKIIVAIDGYSACGKSTTARLVAEALGYRYVDTGAMYRAITLYFLDHHVTITNPREVDRALDAITLSFHVNSHNITETFLNGMNVEDEIRKMRVSDYVSHVSALKPVRTAMVEQQRRMGRDRAIVMDGRDIGTVVFPEAELKIFMTADLLVRAYRRQQELLEKGRAVDLEEVVENLKKRDEIDTSRAESPLQKADDAICLDTTSITVEEQIDEVFRLALSRMISASK